MSRFATTMRDFDETLIFAGANEPPLKCGQMAILAPIIKPVMR